MSTTGGENLKRELAKVRAQADEITVDIGFQGPIASLAAQHEFGNRSLPERPAMRAATRDLENIAAESKATTHDEFVEAGVLMRDAMKNSYLNFDGAPLGQRQLERKRGTPYASDQLIGAEGPKLVSHVGVWIDDEKIG